MRTHYHCCPGIASNPAVQQVTASGLPALAAALAEQHSSLMHLNLAANQLPGAAAAASTILQALQQDPPEKNFIVNLTGNSGPGQCRTGNNIGPACAATCVSCATEQDLAPTFPQLGVWAGILTYTGAAPPPTIQPAAAAALPGARRATGRFGSSRRPGMAAGASANTRATSRQRETSANLKPASAGRQAPGTSAAEAAGAKQARCCVCSEQCAAQPTLLQQHVPSPQAGLQEQKALQQPALQPQQQPQQQLAVHLATEQQAVDRIRTADCDERGLQHKEQRAQAQVQANAQHTQHVQLQQQQQAASQSCCSSCPYTGCQQLVKARLGGQDLAQCISESEPGLVQADKAVLPVHRANLIALPADQAARPHAGKAQNEGLSGVESNMLQLQVSGSCLIDQEQGQEQQQQGLQQCNGSEAGAPAPLAAHNFLLEAVRQQQQALQWLLQQQQTQEQQQRQDKHKGGEDDCIAEELLFELTMVSSITNHIRLCAQPTNRPCAQHGSFIRSRSRANYCTLLCQQVACLRST